MSTFEGGRTDHQQKHMYGKEDLVKATMNLYFVKHRKEGKQNMYMEICSELGKTVMCFMTDDSERSDHGLTKVISQHLPGGIEKNHS